MQRSLLAFVAVVALAALILLIYYTGGAPSAPALSEGPGAAGEAHGGTRRDEAPVAKAGAAEEGGRSKVEGGAAKTSSPVAEATASLRGRLVASESNVPVAGAKLFLELTPRGFARMTRTGEPQVPAATAGADGAFTLRGIPSSRAHELRVEAPGRRRQRIQVPGLSKGEERNLGDLPLDEGAAVEGRVTDPAGAPIQGAVVLARRAPQGGGPMMMGSWPLDIESTTDSQGRYKLDGLGPDEGIVVSAVSEGRIAGTSSPVVPRIGSPTLVGDIVLREGKEVTGRIVERSGAPVAQANIQFNRMGGPGFGGMDFMLDNRAQKPVVTDADGRFRIRGLDDRAIEIEAEASGRGNAKKSGVTPGTRDLVLELEPYAVVRGKLVPAPGVDAKALAGWLESFDVRAIPSLAAGFNSGFFVSSSGRTPGSGDAKVLGGGKFEITGLKQGKYTLEVSGSGFAPTISPPVDVRADRPVESLEIPVAPGRALTVRVTKGGMDEPVAHARVRVKEKREDAMPNFFGGGDEEEEDAPVAGFAPARATRAAVGRSVSVAGAFRGGPSGPLRIGGPGADAAEGRPAPYNSVIETDAAGVARFVGLPEAEFEVSARKQDFASTEPIEVQVAAPAPGEAEPRADLRISEGGTLEGRVLRGGTVEAVGSTVELAGPEPSNARKTAFVDGHGRYRFEHLRAGVYHAVVGKPQSGFGPPQMMMIDNGGEPQGIATRVEDGKVVSLDLEAPILATVTGLVTQAGAPVAGVRVSFAPVREGDFDFGGGPMMDFGGTKSGVTNAEGRYRIENVDLGKYRVRAQKSTAPRPLVVDAEVRGEKEKIDLQLPRGVIEGRIVRAENHEPIANANVSLLEPEDGNAVTMDVMMVSVAGGGGEVMTWDGRSTVRTDKDGKYRLEDVPAGRYRVRARATGFREAKTGNVELGADARLTEVDVKMEKAASLTGRVLGAGGTPRGGVMVQLVRSGQGPGGAPQIRLTDAEGRYRFDSLDPGDYRVWAQSFEGGGLTIGGDSPKSVRVTLDGGQETSKDLQVDS